MFNPVIIVALIVQRLISRVSGVGGAVAGFVITFGVLLWGLSLYAEGSEVGIFGVPLSPLAFFVVCLMWFGLDAKAFFAARRAASVLVASSGDGTSPAAAVGRLDEVPAPRGFHERNPVIVGLGLSGYSTSSAGRVHDAGEK
jgi:hypothetical protein